MIFIETLLPGAYLIEVEPRSDERGFLARTFCEEEFAAHGLRTHYVQCSTVLNHKRGTLRGMHFQQPPYAETKVVRCTIGAVYDVIIDLRPESPTFTKWFATELTAENRRSVYIPPGFAHGMQTLVDNSELLYYISEFYHPAAATGVLWDDPAFGIEWVAAPPEGRIIAAKDLQWARFQA
jgi:dTDP-4-dehydrorhamnose 3,5-epimerase